MPDALVLTLAVLAGAAPWISVRFIAARQLEAARDVWLLGLAWIATAWLCWSALPLGLMSAAVLVHWRSHVQLSAVATWAGIIATWFLIQALPPGALDVLQAVWRVSVVGLVAMGGYQRWRGFEVKATTGSRIVLASLIALVWPFASPWEWPVYAAGLWLTSSWIALAALLVGIAVSYPVTGPWVAGLAVLIAVLLFTPWTRRIVLDEVTPRGASLDGLLQRLRTIGAMLRLTAQWPIWLWGYGPMLTRTGSLERALMRESHRLTVSGGPGHEHLVLATSPTHCEPLELACTYGLLAVAAMSALGWQIVPRLALGDPWSACVLTGAVLSLGQPLRVVPVGLVWLVALAVVTGR